MVREARGGIEVQLGRVKMVFARSDQVYCGKKGGVK